MRGAELHIREDKPKLAFCSYHNNHHIYEVPKLIREYNPDYKLYMRYNGSLNGYLTSEFCLVQTFTLVVCTKQQLDKDEYVYMVSYIARNMEHRESLRTNLTSHLNENDSISAAGLLTLILV